jgi:polyhydroxybutyrate depolymerase
MPVVLALHAFATNALLMELTCGLNDTADQEGFLVVYPSGTGRGAMLHWNDGGIPLGRVDDVGFIARMLDDVEAVARVDSRRVYATGYSNGAMMCYRLASELSERIAAIAPVAGTMADSRIGATRPVSVIHLHGTLDRLAPFDGFSDPLRAARFKSIDETVRAWAEANACPDNPKAAVLPDAAADGTRVRRTVFGPGKGGSEVVLYAIEGGGHTWPGRKPVADLLGRSTRDITGNDVIWEFFRKHPIAPEKPGQRRRGG